MLRKTITSLALLTSLFLTVATSAANLSDVPSGKYKMDLTHASIVWKVSHNGLSNYVARFTDFDIDLNLDSDDLAKSSANAVIQTNSISTEYPHAEKKDFNKKLVETESLFNGKKFPEITFKSTSFKLTDKTTGKLSGDLTFLGITKPVVLDVTLNGTQAVHKFARKPAIGFSAKTTIKREDWGFVKYLPNIGNEVKIEIEAEFIYAE